MTKELLNTIITGEELNNKYQEWLKVTVQSEMNYSIDAGEDTVLDDFITYAELDEDSIDKDELRDIMDELQEYNEDLIDELIDENNEDEIVERYTVSQYDISKGITSNFTVKMDTHNLVDADDIEASRSLTSLIEDIAPSEKWTFDNQFDAQSKLDECQSTFYMDDTDLESTEYELLKIESNSDKTHFETELLGTVSCTKDIAEALRNRQNNYDEYLETLGEN